MGEGAIFAPAGTEDLADYPPSWSARQLRNQDALVCWVCQATLFNLEYAAFIRSELSQSPENYSKEYFSNLLKVESELLATEESAGVLWRDGRWYEI